MKHFLQLSLIAVITITAISCGSSASEQNSGLNKKQTELKEKKEAKEQLEADIKQLEAEILKLDPTAVKPEKPKLVAVAPLAKKDFVHYIDLQGRVDAENISYVAPRGQGGHVKQIFVKKGQNVKKGQLLLKLDNALVLQNIETAKTQLSFAKDLYQRQKNLWDQHIGTEVQLITAKNNVDQLERNIATLQEQLSYSNVYADVSGIADEVNVRVGEFFTGTSPQGVPQIRIVNSSELKAVTNIPENYISRVKKGTPVMITIPDLNKSFRSTITYIGESIGITSRGFTVESKIPRDPSIKPNQVALIKVQDYSAPGALTVPVSTLQTDENGKYVLVAATENGKMITRKKQVEIGELYGDQIEIKSGLNEGDVLITEGFQGLYEGQLVTTTAQ